MDSWSFSLCKTKNSSTVDKLKNELNDVRSFRAVAYQPCHELYEVELHERFFKLFNPLIQETSGGKSPTETEISPAESAASQWPFVTKIENSRTNLKTL